MNLSKKILTLAFLFFFSLNISVLYSLEIPLTVRESEGFTRRSEPVTVGVNLPRGAVTDLGTLCIFAPGNKALPCQFETTATWPDGSVKWVLADFQADCPARGTAGYSLRDSGARPQEPSLLEVLRTAGGVTVTTGPFRCTIKKEGFDLFSAVYLDHNRDGSFIEEERVDSGDQMPGIQVVDDLGRKLSSRWGKVKSFEVEAEGPVRATVAVKGAIADTDGESWLDYTARLHFYSGTGLVRVFFTLENHNPTIPLTDKNGDKHWLMGRPGSFFFKDMSLVSGLKFSGPIQLSVGDGREDILDRVVLTDKGGVYQESSGGENWFHRVHMNHLGQIPMRFRGAKIFLGEVEAYMRNRPDAWLHAADRRFGLAVAVRHFWQNFPKALTAEPCGTVRAALWPGEFPDLHELQGGEIKTHEVAFFFHTGPQGSTPAENRVATVMGAFFHPLYVRAPAEWYLKDGFFDDAVAYDPQRFPTYERLMQGALTNTRRNLLTDIEEDEEYGWRHFGDTPARNEYDETGGPHTGRQAISHFNHEYDHGYGMLFHSLRTASAKPDLSYRWWRLAEAGIAHESDIDIYHTRSDPQAGGAYNGGKFAHTSHGVEVVNASHRGSPRLTWWGSLTWPWGQGQSPESGHFNNRGMMCLYYLTGNRRVLESALELADLVYFKITGNVFPQIDQTDRCSGNNLQILTDAYLLTWDEKYVEAAEKILESTAPEKQWYMTGEGRKANPDKVLEGFWQPAICINAVARWTAVMEEKTGQPYRKGRDYVVRYADFAATYLAAGPPQGFPSSWSPGKKKEGNLGPWTYRVTDVLMFGHKYADDPAVKKRCLTAAQEAFYFMKKSYPGPEPLYYDSKYHTILSGGGHEYTYFMRYGRWPAY
ncbi:MAG TPA: hypothetical protein VM123_04650 [archaeon]|nr:hypothetical protein [archaeon]